MVMQENDETGHTLTVDYTFDPHFALGLYSKYEIGGNEFWMAGPQLNTLLKRWNLPDGQGNIFSMTGAGMARKGEERTGSLDDAAWPITKRGAVFVSYEIRLMYAGDIEKSVWQRAYAGFAPYLANYDQLNTWLLLRVDHHPAKNDHFVVTPVIRFSTRPSGSKPDTAATTTSWSTGPCNSEAEENMRHIMLTLAILITLSGSALAETITTTVNGMVCAFCATGIEKTFRKQPEVATVKVDLEKKLVTI